MEIEIFPVGNVYIDRVIQKQYNGIAHGEAHPRNEKKGGCFRRTRKFGNHPKMENRGIKTSNTYVPLLIGKSVLFYKWDVVCLSASLFFNHANIWHKAALFTLELHMPTAVLNVSRWRPSTWDYHNQVVKRYFFVIECVRKTVHLIKNHSLQKLIQFWTKC